MLRRCMQAENSLANLCVEMLHVSVCLNFDKGALLRSPLCQTTDFEYPNDGAVLAK
jgi:hypothetical protein